MHKCLQIDEILVPIVKELRELDVYDQSEDLPDDGPRSYTVNMALTCRTFYEPAMDALWASLPGLQPLFRLLPEDKVQWRKAQEKECIWRIPTLTGRLLPQDWYHFRRHARRVRSLTIGNLSHNEAGFVSHRWLEILLALSPPIRFSRLRALACFPRRNLHLFRYLPMFLVPSLSHLEYQSTEPDDFVRLLEMVEDYVPTLRSLTGTHDRVWWRGALPAPLLPRMALAISSLLWLTEFTLEGRLEGEALQSVAHLPSLRTLRCVLTRKSFFNAPSTQPQHTFPSLETLELSRGAASSTARFLRLIPSRRLIYLRISARTSLEPDELRDLMVSISTHTFLQSLLLEFTEDRYPEDEYEDKCEYYGPHWASDACIEAEEILQPLVHLHCLEHFSIDALPVRYTGSLLSRLAPAWEHLRILKLGALSGEFVRRIRVYDLLPFAKHCSTLAEIACAAHPHVPPMASIARDEYLGAFLTEGPPSASSLKRIDVGDELFKPESLSHLAQFLATSFPVAEIRFSGERATDDEHYNQIQQVDALKEEFLRERMNMKGGCVQIQTASTP